MHRNPVRRELVASPEQWATLLCDFRQQGTDYWAGATIKSSPAASDGRLYIVVSNGSQRRLYCFTP